MQNETFTSSVQFTTKEELNKTIIWISVLITVLFVIIILIGFVGYLIYRKLRQHEEAISNLLDRVHVQSTSTRSPFDSAIELRETDSSQFRPLSETSSISNSHNAKPRFSIKIHKEEANVYTHQAPIEQLMMTAQDYYSDTTKSQIVEPVENVQVINKRTNERTVVSSVFEPNLIENTPTSMLFDGTTDNVDGMITCNKGLFVHKTVGYSGGKLSVSGISLDIPTGALEKPTLLSLGVLWDEKFSPNLSKKQALLSPIVLCQPPGLKFKIPVTLTFPHAAVNIKSDWEIKFLKREGPLKESQNWCSVTLEDYEERMVTDKRVSLNLKHFTLYACVGESKPGSMAAKNVYLVAFIGKLQKWSFFKPKIYCLNKYEELKDIDPVTKPSLAIADTTTLIIHDNQRDVTVEVAKLSEQWELAGENVEVLPFEQVWHAFHPCCTFIMKPRMSGVHEIMCEIHAYQNGAENCAAKIKIAESLAPSFSPLVQLKDDHQENLMKELIILLDPLNNGESNAGDWRNLAEKMGCGLARIRWLATQKSPTQVLIEKWIDEKNNFAELEKLMIEINRPDAAEEIKKHFPDVTRHTDTQ